MSAESLFSPLWYRVSELRPRIPSHVHVQPQKTRGQVWYVFNDGASSRQVRINGAAYQFVGRCDGRHTVHEIWEAVLDLGRDDAPTQDEIIALLSQLSSGGLLHMDALGDVEALFERGRERQRRTQRQSLNPLAIRIPLVDPSRVLRRLEPLAQAVFRTPVLWLWAAVVCVAVAVGLTYWKELSAHAATYMLTPRYLFLLWACYPLVKGIHEFAHALAIRRWGGEVPEMGVTLLVLVPAPYVDASAASAFPHRHQRVTVSAAGIMAELAFAALALFVWLNVENGWIQDIAFVCMFIGTVSTILFNGNPLLRFDGYYVLADALDSPNLAPRSTSYWAYIAQRYLLRIQGAASPEPAAGERGWLLCYAPISFVYRLFVSGLIVLWVGAKSLPLGMAAGAFVAYTTLILPAFKLLRFALTSPAVGRRRAHARFIALGIAAALLVMIGVIPMPFHTVAEGIVWLPEQARVRAETDGFVLKLVAQDGARVEQGQVIALLEDPELPSSKATLEGKIEALEAQQYDVLLSDPLKAQNATEEMARTRAELARVEERIAQLEVRANVAGKLVMPHQQDLPGTFAKQGTMLGYVLTPGAATLRAVLAEEDVAPVREQTRHVEVRLAEAAGESIEATLLRETPAASYVLPSAALGDRGGGTHVTDPTDKDRVRTLQPVFLVDLTVPSGAVERIGGRVWVRFEHGAEPLAMRWTRRLAQLFLKHFNPVS